MRVVCRRTESGIVQFDFVKVCLGFEYSGANNVSKNMEPMLYGSVIISVIISS